MAFNISPAVTVTERDLTTIVPAVGTTAAGFAGAFQWGPVGEVVLVDSENYLKATFGLPDETVAEYWWSAANFLSYSNNLQIVRAINESVAKNAVAEGSAVLIRNRTDYEQNADTYAANKFAAKYPGLMGNSIELVIIDSTYTGLIRTYGNVTTINFSDVFDRVPGTSSYARSRGYEDINDEVHVFVIDRYGKFSGTPGTILERYEYLSKLRDGKKSDGTSSYYANVLNDQSPYVWFLDHPGIAGDNSSSSSSAHHTDWGLTLEQLGTPDFHSVFDVLPDGYYVGDFDGGVDGNVLTPSDLTGDSKGFNLFTDSETIDVSLIIAGPAGSTDASEQDIASVHNYLLTTVANRKDCVIVVSPPKQTVVNVQSISQQTDNVVEYFTETLNVDTSYGVADSGWMYQYDRYRDTYTWTPLNACVAGTCVRTDLNNDPWWSPAGYNRGQINNVVKLAYNPRGIDRDTLYKYGINPVISQRGQGTILYGDKTMLSRPSAFDRINVRRLFIVLEKSIATAAKFMMFEFNDDFTRNQFKSMIEPFLRDVQARRGVTDFKVVCDTTNNPGSVVDRNEFVADIYIKPTRSINYITLNFVATRTDVSFTEVGA